MIMVVTGKRRGNEEKSVEKEINFIYVVFLRFHHVRNVSITEATVGQATRCETRHTDI